MATIRTFVAAVLSGASEPWIGLLQSELSNVVGPNAIKLTPLHQIHLTLVFLGDTETRSLTKLASLMETAQIKLPIGINIKSVGQFSRNGIVSVVWAGIEKNKLLDATYLKLIDNLGKVVKLESKAFNPHLTLARLRSEFDPEINRKLITFLETKRSDLPIKELITEIVLFKSDLKPTGPVYTRIHTIKMQDEIQ